MDVRIAGPETDLRINPALPEDIDATTPALPVHDAAGAAAAETLAGTVVTAGAKDFVRVQVSGESTLEFSRPNDGTAYAAGDVIAAVTADTGVTVLQVAITAPHNGAVIELDEVRAQTNKTGLTNRLREHFYNDSSPPTAVPGDNTAMARAFANRVARLGSEDLPGLVSQTDNSAVHHRLPTPLVLKCADDDNKIYVRHETVDAQAVDANQTYFLHYKYRVVG